MRLPRARAVFDRRWGAVVPAIFLTVKGVEADAETANAAR
jgi:hypothetical protein